MPEDTTDQTTREETFEILISEPAGGKFNIEARCAFLDQPVRLPTPANLPAAGEWKDRLAQLQDALILSAKPSNDKTKYTRDAAVSPSFEEAGRQLPLQHLFPPRITREVGLDLYDLIFVKEIYTAYTKCRTDAENVPIPLKVRLTFSSSGLSYLPWETLYDGHDHLALSTRSSVIRKAGIDQDVSLPVIKMPIAILGMVPRAKDLRVDIEQENIRKALELLPPSKRPELSWANGSPRNLVQCLRRPKSAASDTIRR